MKEFPYAQQIIWERDVEQIEWNEGDDYVQTSGVYLAKLVRDNNLILGYWYFSKKGGDVFFVYNNSFAIYEKEILCWAKL